MNQNVGIKMIFNLMAENVLRAHNVISLAYEPFRDAAKMALSLYASRLRLKKQKETINTQRKMIGMRD